jgi:hypothetical protein
MRVRRKTIFVDIDGTIAEHHGNLSLILLKPFNILDGVYEKFLEWRDKDYAVVVTTARPEGLRTFTEKQLTDNGLFFDQLVMGLPVGERVVINDNKPDGETTARGICVKRNIGLREVGV